MSAMIILVLTLYLSAANGQVIVSSLDGRAACPGEDVNLTCRLDPENGRLTWVIGPSDNTLLFNLGDNSSLTTQTDSTGQFTAYLIHYSRYPPPLQFLGNITSTLNTRVDPSLNNYPISILCLNGLNHSISIPSFISVAEPPSPPQNVTVEVKYGVSEYSLIVQWNSPRDDGRVEIDNYILSLYIVGKVLDIETTSFSQQLSLNYSMDYSLTLTASNCAGTSSPLSLTSMEAGYRAPLAGVDVIIEEYSSTVKGAVIQFHCQNGYHPTEWVTSQCINSSWSHDPLDLSCVENIVSYSTIPSETSGFVATEDVNTSIVYKNNPLPIIVVGVVCSVLFLSVGVLLGVMGLYLIQRVRRKFSGSSFSSPSPHPPPVNYEEVGVAREVKSSQDIQLTTNEAYGPIQNILSETNTVF